MLWLEEELEQVEKELGVSREDIDEIKDIDIDDELETAKETVEFDMK